MIVIIIITCIICLIDLTTQCQISYNITSPVSVTIHYDSSFCRFKNISEWHHPGGNLCATSPDLCILHDIFLLPLHKKGNIAACGIFSHNVVIVSLTTLNTAASIAI